MAGCSAVVVSRSAQVASTRSPFALTHVDIASPRLSYVAASPVYLVGRVRVQERESKTAPGQQEETEEMADGV